MMAISRTVARGRGSAADLSPSGLRPKVATGIREASRETQTARVTTDTTRVSDLEAASRTAAARPPRTGSGGARATAHGDHPPSVHQPPTYSALPICPFVGITRRKPRQSRQTSKIVIGRPARNSSNTHSPGSGRCLLPKSHRPDPSALLIGRGVRTSAARRRF